MLHPDRNIRNADTVEDIPGDLLLGIAYPCLEDGLNDFAVIRTTFETLDLFPEDDPIRDEMMEIVNDARSNLLRRLNELRDKIHTNHAHFLGTDYNEFKSYALGHGEPGLSDGATGQHDEAERVQQRGRSGRLHGQQRTARITTSLLPARMLPRSPPCPPANSL